MKIVAQFNPNTPTNGLSNPSSGSFNATIRPGPGKILVINNSIVDLIFNFTSTADSDIVPALSYRIFEMALASWVINWSSVNAIQYQNFSTNTVGTETIVIAYEISEDIPILNTLASFINPRSSNLTSIQLPLSLTISGTAASQGVLQRNAGTNQHIYISWISAFLVQTASSSDSATLYMKDLVAGSNITLFEGHINNVNNQAYYARYDPPYDTNAVTCTLTTVAGSGVSHGCDVTVGFIVV